MGASFDIEDSDGNLPLHYVAAGNLPLYDVATDYMKEEINVDIIGMLLSKDPSQINKQNKHGNNPLHYAMQFAGPKTADTLLKNGADFNNKNKCGETPLDYGYNRDCMLDVISKYVTNYDKEIVVAIAAVTAPLVLKYCTTLSTLSIVGITIASAAVTGMLGSVASTLLNQPRPVAVANTHQAAH